METNKNTESKPIQWYGIFPYTEIIKTSEQKPYMFALLLNDKLVAIGVENEREGGVLASVILMTWTEFNKTMAQYQKNLIWMNAMIEHAKITNPAEIDKAKRLTKLFNLIKGKRYIGRKELPPQPKQMIYRTIFADRMYIIYENKWKQPRRFTLWSAHHQANIAKSNKLSDITERLSRIVGRQITIVQ